MAHGVSIDYGVINMASACMRNAYYDASADKLEEYHDALVDRINDLEIENAELRVGKSKWRERD